MFTKYEIISFDPNRVSDKLLDSFLVFDKSITKELIPEHGLASKESRKKDLKIKDPSRDSSYWVAVLQENNKIKTVGISRLSVLNEKSPAYEQNGHIAGCSVLVLSDFSRQGIGTALLDKSVEKAKEYGFVTDLMFRTFNESGYSFLEKYGANLVLEQNRSYLNLRKVDLDLMNKWNTLGNELMKKENIRLLEIEGSIPENIIEQYASLYTEIMNQQPLGSLQLRNVTTPDVLRTRAEQMKETDQHWHTILTIEENGQISGLTEFHYSFNQPDIIFQLLTGVKEEYRKRGLGKWLKANMLLFMLKKYPNAKYIETSNTVSNDAMISINRRMGFYDKEPLKFYELKIK